MNDSGADCHGWAPTNGANMYGGDYVCVCVLAHACARVRAYACVLDVFAIYDNHIWPRLIMIIIQIIILFSYKPDTLMISPQRVPG